MSRFRTALACTVAALFAVAACQESGQLVEPESSQVNASGAVDGAAVTAADCDVTVDDDDGESIQTDGVDAAGTGDVVCVEPGTYAENVSVNKEITLRGTTDPSGANPAVVDGQLSVNGSGAGATIARLRVAPTDVFDVDAGGIDPFGIRVTVSDVLVANNVVEGVSGDATGGPGSGTVHGIQVWNGSPPFVTGVTVRDNTVLDVENRGDASLGFPNYGGAAGIKVQGMVRNVDVTGNQVRGVHSAGWVYGVTLSHTNNDPQARSPENVTVEGNTLAELNDGSVHDVFTNPGAAPFPGVAVGIDDTENPTGPGGADADQASVAFNNFLSTPIGAQNKDQVHTLVAECNYWGHASGPSNAANQADKGTSAVGDVDYRPWSVREIGVGANPGKSCVGGKNRGGGAGQ